MREVAQLSCTLLSRLAFRASRTNPLTRPHARMRTRTHTLACAPAQLTALDGSRWLYPTCFLTNGGGVTEEHKAQQLTNWLGVAVSPQQVRWRGVRVCVGGWVGAGRAKEEAREGELGCHTRGAISLQCLQCMCSTAFHPRNPVLHRPPDAHPTPTHGRTRPRPPPPKQTQIILSHTPMRDLVPSLGDRPVLVSGRGETLAVARSYGFTAALHTRELGRAMPAATPFSTYPPQGKGAPHTGAGTASCPGQAGGWGMSMQASVAGWTHSPWRLQRPFKLAAPPARPDPHRGRLPLSLPPPQTPGRRPAPTAAATQSPMRSARQRPGQQQRRWQHTRPARCGTSGWALSSGPLRRCWSSRTLTTGTATHSSYATRSPAAECRHAASGRRRKRTRQVGACAYVRARRWAGRGAGVSSPPVWRAVCSPSPRAEAPGTAVHGTRYTVHGPRSVRHKHASRRC